MSEVNDVSADEMVLDESQEILEEGDEQLEVEASEEDQEEQEPLNKTEKKQIAELRKKLKLQVNGKEIEEEIDWNDEEKLRTILQKGYAADAKFQEAAKTRKEAEDYRSAIEKQAKSIFKQLENDPFEVLKKLGKDPDEYFNKRMQQKLEEMQKSPEQKAKEIEEQKNKELENYKKELEEIKYQQQVREQQVKLETEILSALETAEILPKNPYYIGRIASIMEKGYSAADAVEMLETEYENSFKDLDLKKIERLLGQEKINEMRKARLELKKSTPSTARHIKDIGKKKPVEKQQEEKISVEEFFKNLK